MNFSLVSNTMIFVKLGSLVAMSVYSRVPIKVVLVLCVLLQSVVILGFAFSNGQFWVMATCRYFTGCFQVFISIFAPIWSDTYAPEDRKARWITLITVATPSGMVTGYLLTAIILSWEKPWQITFFLQIIGLTPILVTILVTDNKYLRIQGGKKKAGDGPDDAGAEDSEDFRPL